MPFFCVFCASCGKTPSAILFESSLRFFAANLFRILMKDTSGWLSLP